MYIEDMQRILFKFILGIDLETRMKMQSLQEKSLHLEIQRLKLENEAIHLKLQQVIHDLNVKHGQTLLTLADAVVQVTELIEDAVNLANLQADEELAKWISQSYEAFFALTRKLVKESESLLTKLQKE